MVAGGPAPKKTATKAPAMTTAKATPASPATPTATALSPSEASAQGLINTTLANYDLGSLAGWAWNKHLNGESIDQIMLEIQQTPEFKARYPALEALAKDGHAISVDEYRSQEIQYANYLSQYGMPKELWSTPANYAKWIEGYVSPSELGQRLAAAQTIAVGNAPPEAREALQKFDGVGDSVGAITSYYLDPKNTLNHLQQAVTAAQIAGVSKVSGFGDITRDQAYRLGALGVTLTQANSGFASLSQMLGLQQPLLNESPNELGTDTLLDAVFGNNGIAQQTLQRRQASRVAAFAGDTQFTQQAGGRTGVGTARQA